MLVYSLNNHYGFTDALSTFILDNVTYCTVKIIFIIYNLCKFMWYKIYRTLNLKSGTLSLSLALPLSS